MDCPLESRLERELRARVLATDPNFVSAKSYVTSNDTVICDAPLGIGKMLATMGEIRKENKNPEISQFEKETNFLRMRFLDLWIKSGVRECVDDPLIADYAKVCMHGKIFFRARQPQQAE